MSTLGCQDCDRVVTESILGTSAHACNTLRGRTDASLMQQLERIRERCTRSSNHRVDTRLKRVLIVEDQH